MCRSFLAVPGCLCEALLFKDSVVAKKRFFLCKNVLVLRVYIRDPMAIGEKTYFLYLITIICSSEQYEAFLKFNHDQLHRRFGESAASCKY